jgi:hypothetical protein
MADNDATAALFREILGMTTGGTAGGRGPMSIPDEIMDSVAGDAAQETLARNKLLTEMRRYDDTRRGAEFVNLDLMMEMDSGDVDKFLTHARKKIIKRSKPSRSACCAKIGGVLDQILGTAGGEHAELQGIRDRGAADPTGDVDQVAESASDDLLNFIAEEFFHFEHDDSCKFADPRFDLNPDPLAEHKFISGATKSPGLLRDFYHLREGEGIPVEKARVDYARLQERADALAGNQSKLFERLGLYLGLLGSAAPAKQEEDKTNMEASKTAKALSGFVESQNPYAAAKAGSGKGAPDADKMSKTRCYTDGIKTRDDNKEYPTDLKPAKSGNKTIAGEPGKLSTRDKAPGDPIGEDTRPVSNTAKALGSFMESTGQYETAKKKLALKGKDAGETDVTNREKQPFGLPLKSCKSERASADVIDAGGKKPRFEKDADPIGGASEKDAAGSRMKK